MVAVDNCSEVGHSQLEVELELEDNGCEELQRAAVNVQAHVAHSCLGHHLTRGAVGTAIWIF